jgi:hypothetical protein
MKRNSNKPPVGHWARRAERARDAQRRVHETYASRSRGPTEYAAWQGAVAEFRAVMDSTYPPEFWIAYEAMKRGEDADRDPVLEFLEADPYFDGSGYVKAQVLRWLKRFDLTEPEKERVRGIVLTYVSRPARLQEWREYGRVARKVDSSAFRAGLGRLLTDGSPSERERAGHILNLLGATWPPEFAERFRRRLLLAVTLPEARTEFLHCLKFARRVSTPELRAELRRVAREGENYQQVRADWVLSALGERRAEGRATFANVGQDFPGVAA